MNNDKLRRRLIFESARLIYSGQESLCMRAKLKAARRLCRGWVKPRDLPSDAEIRLEIQRHTGLYEGDAKFDNLREVRLTALRMLRLLRRFKPRVTGSTLAGQFRHNGDIQVQIFTNNLNSVCELLDAQGLPYQLEQKPVRRLGKQRIDTRIRVRERFPVELACYSADHSGLVLRSPLTGAAMARADLREFEELLRHAYPDLDLKDSAPSHTGDSAGEVDRFQLYRMLLMPLAKVVQSRVQHPEGDALYHSLQVFELARGELPYDEEFLLAALLHDVGKAIDPLEHVAAGLEALGSSITPRTAWLISQHQEGHRILEGSIGNRARRRLQSHPDYEELLLLTRCDRQGRIPGGAAPELDEALDAIRDVVRICGSEPPPDLDPLQGDRWNG